jgi:hypothetical protein
VKMEETLCRGDVASTEAAQGNGGFPDAFRSDDGGLAVDGGGTLRGDTCCGIAMIFTLFTGVGLTSCNEASSPADNGCSVAESGPSCASSSRHNDICGGEAHADGGSCCGSVAPFLCSFAVAGGACAFGA